MDSFTQMNTYQSFVSMLGDTSAKDESKLKAAQELSENLEVIINSAQYPAFLDHAIKNLMKILQEGEAHFIAEYNIQQVRKLILEIIHRLPTNDLLRPYVKPLLSLMFKLLETENEENVIICLRIVFELHKQYRPAFNPEIQHFLQLVKDIYRRLPHHVQTMLETKSPVRVKDLSDLNMDTLLQETCCTFTIVSESRSSDGNNITYNLIPKAVMSLKVLQELPIIVVLMYQLYKQNIHSEVSEFIPLIMETIGLHPSAEQRSSPSFNREVYVDFIGAQIKTLSFLAYIIRIYQEVVANHATAMVQGILGLLAHCPSEVAHLRKELLIATRHILATELRIHFLPFMEQLFDENLLLGQGWTTHETLRPLAYSTLADLVHHIRQHLPLADLTQAVRLFSRNVHDEALPTSIQTMSCKLLLNLVECVRHRSDVENGQGREIMMAMLDVLVLKFKTFVKLQLPVLLAKAKQDATQGTDASSGNATPSTGAISSSAASSASQVTNTPGATTTSESLSWPSPASQVEDTKTGLGGVEASAGGGGAKSEKEKSRFTFPSSQASSYNVVDCRNLVKTLVCGVKTITWACTSRKTVNEAAGGGAGGGAQGQTVTVRSFHSKETLVFVRLVKWAMQALDVYSISAPNAAVSAGSTGNLSAGGAAGTGANGASRQPLQQTLRTKEEKEVLEHFAGVFALMQQQTFKEVFTAAIDVVVERIYHNNALQVIANSFLANPSTSAIFATILVEFLLERMEDMGSNVERSNLYLKLFKLVFGSVSLFAAENEQMLRPHLPSIVNRSMELALSAKEPYNYFLLLRALFRSIGGGSHDLLYQEFLPLLPSLLQGLNGLQSSLHKQHMKDLFVELCLTVPVRLSSLLPYLPMLMDPLVSALNGSSTLVSQGLRTLELCVDNLQPDFLYEHIQPVRAELMQALWRTLRNPNDQIAHVAFRVLGKFGGGNRKMMFEPQKLEYHDKEAGPFASLYFQDYKTSVNLPLERVIDAACTALKSSQTEAFHRKHCWEVLRCYIMASMQLEDQGTLLPKLLSHASFREGPVPSVQNPALWCCDKQARSVLQQALAGMFAAAAIKDLRQYVLPGMISIVRHYTLVAIAQQTGPFPVFVPGRSSRSHGMDPLVLVDALATVIGHEEKELCKPGHLALVLMLETAQAVVGSKERACKLPLMEYLVDKLCGLCYERAWYAKLGGCMAIRFLFEKMALKWVLDHQFVFVKALLFIMMDLTGEVSSGAVEMAKTNLEKLLTLCASPASTADQPELMAAQKKSLHDVTHELVRQVTSPNSVVRQQAMHSIQLLATLTNQNATTLMEPHKDVLVDMIPPKKHLLRHQPVNAQVGLMEGNTFCTTLQPRLFTIDVSIVEHKVFFTELLTLCEAEDTVLLKFPCYKSLSNLIPLRRSALQALAACYYIPQCRDKIFAVINKALNSGNVELQQVGFGCMKKFLAGCQVEMEMIHAAMRPLLLQMGDYRGLTTNVITRLSYTTQLFPNVFNEKFCEQLLQHLRKWLELCIFSYKSAVATARNTAAGATPTSTQNGAASGGSHVHSSAELKTAADIVGLYQHIPAASARFIEILCKLVFQTEKALVMELGSPFRIPLLKFLVRYPDDTLQVFLRDDILLDGHWSRYLLYMIQEQDGEPIRTVLYADPQRIMNLINSYRASLDGSATPATPQRSHVLSHALNMIKQLVCHNAQWIIGQQDVIGLLFQIFSCNEYQEQVSVHMDDMISPRWYEYQLMCDLLLQYVRAHPEEIHMLFHLLRALCVRTIADFQALKEFLETTVAQNHTPEWKRSAFFAFVEMFRDPNTTQELSAKVLQYVLIPCFSVSFERGEGERLVGSPPAPEQDCNENVVSVFINKVIDPDNPYATSDAVRILLLQFSCLLVEQASPHIHDAANKRQGNKLRRLMTFAWPCLLSKNCVDPTTRYHGHLLLSHIIAKFAIHKRIVLQVFHSLLKAHAVEARGVVRQALEVLTPAMPLRMEDGNTMLTHWTKKIIVEEGHTIAQLVHILQLVVRHYKVYYPVRHHLVQYMVTSIQRLGFTPTATVEHKKLAVDLAEVVLKWELQRMDEESDGSLASPPAAGGMGDLGDSDVDSKRSFTGSTSSGGPSEAKRIRLHSTGGTSTTGTGRPVSELNKPIEKKHCDAIANFLLRLACQVNDTAAGNGGSAQGDQLSRRCVGMLKKVLKPDVWPQCDLKLGWFDRLFLTMDAASAAGTGTGSTGNAGAAGGAGASGTSQPPGGQANLTNITTALELLTFLLGVLRKEQILAGFKNLHRGITSLITSTNPKILRHAHQLLAKLMTLFPTEPTNSSVASKYEELDGLYAAVGKAIYEGFAAYEKNASATPSSILGTVLMLKAACSNNSCYIDRLITTFMRVLHRLTREHLLSSGDSASVGSELLIMCLELVRNRVGVMGLEMRKAFIGSILVGLIEKSPDAKVVKAIIQIIDGWMRTKSPIAINQGPSLREKSILLVKLMQFVEKRFPDDLELNISFLEVVLYIYQEETLRTSDLASKLEPAFMAGLRCTQLTTRSKFFQVFDASMKRRLHDRLMYIVCSQNWEAIGAHYWIKQCIELVTAAVVKGMCLQITPEAILLPNITHVLRLADPNERAMFITSATLKEEPDFFAEPSIEKEEEMEVDLGTASSDTCRMFESGAPGPSLAISKPNLQLMLSRHLKFLDSVQDIDTARFMDSVAQLCHADTSLAETVWLDLFPRLWKLLNERQQQALGAELSPFLSSGAHVIQKDCQLSAINTFLEALSRCQPSVPLAPALLKYLGKSHNAWHRSTLLLEQMALDSAAIQHTKLRKDALEPPIDVDNPSPMVVLPQQVLDSLSEMYFLLREEDLWAGLWQKRAAYSETAIAVACEQHGLFEQAQGTYELAMNKVRQDFNDGSAPTGFQSELKLLEEHWIRCTKELNQWDLLQDYGEAAVADNPQLLVEAAWRIPNWALMRDALSQVELACPREQAWKLNLFRGLVSLCHPEEQQLSLVERHVELANTLCIREWRRLPAVVANVHLPLLQAAQQVVELQEAVQIRQGLANAVANRAGGVGGAPPTAATSLHDLKATVKTWRNRLPVIADDLSHWSDIFSWRQHHYQVIVSHFEQMGDQQVSNQGMLGVHASAQAIIHFGKVARKHGLPTVCLETLSRIYSIPSVPIVDCFQKIRQQVKCYLQMAATGGKNELQEGLDVIESTNLKYFTKEMTAELYALKGMLLAQLGRSDDANKAFSAAVQLHDTLGKAWALWGEYLEQIFVSEPRNHKVGVEVITCFLHACRHQNEPKARKYIAKVLWLLTYDDEKLFLTEAVDKYSMGVPPLLWLAWIPQLLTCLVRIEGKLILNLISQVGKMYPQAVYFPVRTLYLTLKIEQREKYKAGELAASSSQQEASTAAAQPANDAAGTSATDTPASQTASTSASQGSTTSTPSASQGENVVGGPIRATPPMWRCSRIMHMQRDLHPTILSSLEGIVDQMVWFRENWYEEVLRQLRQGLTKCHAVAFESRNAVTEATITPHTLSFVKKLVATFGIGIENIASSATGTFSSAASESIARRAQATAQDPVFQRMKTQFSTDFDFSLPGAMKLHNLIHKLKKWIKILETKTKLLPKSFLIEEKCRFLSNFNIQTAEVELPGEFLLPKHAHYYVRIARFLPRVEIVQKHNTAARRLYIRGHNGKIYPYLVVNDAGLGDARREERILQLFRMLNHYLDKEKGTSRRQLHITVPKVVAVSPQMRLVEDCSSGLPLLEIYRQRCMKLSLEYDMPVSRYYERIAGIQARSMQTSHQVLRDIFKEVQSAVVPSTLFKDWALSVFPSATSYWTFRKMFTQQMAMMCLMEYVFHLTRVNPDMLYIHQDSGFVNVAYFKFDVDDLTGELDANRPVPFRLTPNIAEFLSPIGVSGPFTANLVAAARCLAQPSMKLVAISKAILRDEMITWQKRKMDDRESHAGSQGEAEQLVNAVNKAVSAILSRLQSLAVFDGADSKVVSLVATATSPDNLCRMDPAWHPWL